MKQRIVITIILILTFLSGKSQIGGTGVYPFLDFTYSARISGLGGGLIVTPIEDPSILTYNPSMISDQYHQSFSAHFVDHFSNSTYGSALYSHTFKKAGSFAYEMRFIGYGTFDQTDEAGNVLGTFSAGDYVATVGWGRKLSPHFSIGANLKLIYSNYAEYNSFGLGTDVAGTYFNPEKQLGLSILFKNMGSQIVTYTPGKYERLPFDIQLAFSKKLEHLPARFHISLHSLYKWEMGYVGRDNPFIQVDAITGEPKYPSLFEQGVKNFFRHFTFGVEILPSPSFSLFASFNYNRSQEMLIPVRRTAAGLSYGFSLNIKSIQLGFARSHYAIGAAPIYINISTNFGKIRETTQQKKKLKQVQTFNE